MICPTIAITSELRAVSEVFISTTSRPAPTLRLLQGNPPTTFEYKISRPILVHFWATWCAPCIEELPSIVSSSNSFKRAGIDVILVSVDTGAATKVPSFLKKIGLENTEVYWDPRSELYKRFALSVLPSTVLINAQGKEIGRVIGPALWTPASNTRFLLSKINR